MPKRSPAIALLYKYIAIAVIAGYENYNRAYAAVRRWFVAAYTFSAIVAAYLIGNPDIIHAVVYYGDSRLAITPLVRSYYMFDRILSVASLQKWVTAWAIPARRSECYRLKMIYAQEDQLKTIDFDLNNDCVWDTREAIPDASSELPTLPGTPIY